MEVDDATRLVFRDLDEPDGDGLPETGDGDAGQGGKLAGQVGDEPAPQVPRVGVEQHGGGVVVAVRAHRLAEAGISLDMAGRAGDIMTVRATASLGVAAGTAGPGQRPGPKRARRTSICNQLPKQALIVSQ